MIPAVVPSITVVKTDVALKCVCRPAASQSITAATVAVAAGGDATFTVNGAGDASIGASGVLDLSTPGTYTDMGKVVDEINSSTNGWRAMLWGSVRANLTDNRIDEYTSASGLQIVRSLLHDTTVVGATSTNIIGTRITKENLFGGSDAGWYNILTAVDGVYTAAAQVGYVKVYSCNSVTKVDTLIWQSPALASGTAFVFDFNDWGSQDIYSLPGESLCVQLAVPSGAALTAPTFNVKGFHKLIGASVNREGMICEV